MAVATARPPVVTNDVPVSPESTRLLYLDNLKVLLVVGVIAAHAATHYLGAGAWLDMQNRAGETIFIGIVGAAGLLGGLFWIGLFFLIAGLLAPGSLAHHGVREFLKDRAVRLGVPFLVFVLVVMPSLHYVVYLRDHGAPGTAALPWSWLSDHWWLLDAGTLWFVGDLFVFSAAYAAWWRIRPQGGVSLTPLRGRVLIGLAAGITVGSFIVHFSFPLFSKQFLDLHLTQWPQYILLFWFGTISAERGWLVALSDRLWRGCGWAILAAVISLPFLGLLGGAMTGQTDSFTGGLHWQALATAAVEGTLAVAGSLWLFEYFRRHYNRQGAHGRALTRCAYGAYVVHGPLLFLLALVLVPVGLPNAAGFLLLAPATLLLSFGTAWFLVVRFRIARGVL